MIRIYLFILLSCTACLTREIAIYSPSSHKAIQTIRILPVVNTTDYDAEPFNFERSLRQFIQQKYNLKTESQKADANIRLTFISFKRGRLPLSGDANSDRTLTAQAKIELLDEFGELLSSSHLAESENYTENRPEDFEQARDFLLSRLSERLVVDLLEF